MTASPTSEPTLVPFSRSVVEEGWTVVALEDASQSVHRIRVIREVRADAVVQIYYACAGDGQISIRLIDGQADPSPYPGMPPRELVSFATACNSELQLLTAPGPSRRTTIYLETAVTEQGARYWTLTTVPEADALPRG